MNHRNRLRALERNAQSGRACNACGHGAGEPNFQVSWYDDPAPDGPERCPECGTSLIVRLQWPDDPIRSGLRP